MVPRDPGAPWGGQALDIQLVRPLTPQSCRVCKTGGACTLAEEPGPSQTPRPHPGSCHLGPSTTLCLLCPLLPLPGSVPLSRGTPLVLLAGSVGGGGAGLCLGPRGCDHLRRVSTHSGPGGWGHKCTPPPSATAAPSAGQWSGGLAGLSRRPGWCAGVTKVRVGCRRHGEYRPWWGAGTPIWSSVLPQSELQALPGYPNQDA